MTHTELSEPSGSWLMPAWEHARVRDVMRAGVMTCAPSASLRSVARTMASHHVHAIVVAAESVDRTGRIAERAWGIVSDHAMAQAGADAAERTAGDVAEPDPPIAEPHWSLQQAADVMRDRGVTHLVVVDEERRPIGMLSTLDLAGVVAWGRG